MLTMRAPLQKQCIPSRALIPQILNGGLMKYPTRKKIQHKLDDDRFDLFIVGVFEMYCTCMFLMNPKQH